MIAGLGTRPISEVEETLGHAVFVRLGTRTWSPLPPMPTARSGTAKAVVNGRIHVLGGEGWIGDKVHSHERPS
jgi:hypothetical protein